MHSPGVLLRRNLGPDAQKIGQAVVKICKTNTKATIVGGQVSLSAEAKRSPLRSQASKHNVSAWAAKSFRLWRLQNHRQLKL